MAGFKYKSFSFVGQSTDFPAGSANIRVREEFITKGIAQAIIDTNTGWTLDTTRSATITTFSDVPNVGTTTKFSPALFLTNTVSNNKLFICYCDNTANHGVDLSDDQMITTYHVDHLSDGTGLTGLCMSMIPGDSNQSFGASFDSSFIPSSGIRLASDCISYSSNTSNYTLSNTSASGTTYTYDVFATPYCIFFRIQKIIGYAVGRVLGDLAHSTRDTTAQSRYGVIYFKRCASESELGTTVLQSNSQIAQVSYSSAYGGVCLGSSPTNSITYESNYTKVIPFNMGAGYSSTTSTSSLSPYTCWAGASSVCNADGTWLGNTSERVVCYYPDNPALCRNTGIVNTSDSTRRWVPFICFMKTTNTNVHGIIPGDGIKGFLDTNLFIYTGGTAGLLLDNGNYYNISAQLTIGWDPTNDLPNQ